MSCMEEPVFYLCISTDLCFHDCISTEPFIPYRIAELRFLAVLSGLQPTFYSTGFQKIYSNRHCRHGSVYSMASVVNMSVLVLPSTGRQAYTLFLTMADTPAFAGATVPSGIAVFLFSVLIRPNTASKLSQIVCIAIPLAAGLSIFWYLCMKIRIPEIDTVNRMVLSGLKRVRSMFSRHEPTDVIK